MKKHNAAVRVVAVEPASSPVLSGGKAGPHRLQGIGANFVPGNYDASVIDEVLSVADDDAFRAARELAATEGLLAGISSGAAPICKANALWCSCPIQASATCRRDCIDCASLLVY